MPSVIIADHMGISTATVYKVLNANGSRGYTHKWELHPSVRQQLKLPDWLPEHAPREMDLDAVDRVEKAFVATDPAPNVSSVIRRDRSGYGPSWTGLQTRSV
jgi:hypothetical protein